MIDASPFNIILVWPLVNALMVFYTLLHAIGLPYALGFAIILLTIAIRLITAPLTAKQLIASKKMQALAPHLSHLKTKHKGDATMLQQESMRLYKEHGVNPLAGCLPVLLQLPILWGLYSALDHTLKLANKDVIATINTIVYADWLRLTKPWDQQFFGLQLGQSPIDIFQNVTPLIALVPVLTGVLQFLQTKMIMVTPPALPTAKKDKKKGKAEEKKPEMDDFATTFQKQSTYIFPAMIGIFSFTFPLGLSLYWNTFTVFGILQQYKILGLGGLEDWVTILKKKIKQ